MTVCLAMLRVAKWASLAALMLGGAGTAAQESPYTLAAMSKLTCTEFNDKVNEGKQLGDPEASYSAAQLLIRRVCFRYDPKAYVALLQQAVERGHLKAHDDLGYAYALGEGVQQSYQTAGELMLKAQKQLPSESVDPYTWGYTNAFVRLTRRKAIDLLPFTWRYRHLLRVSLQVDPLGTSSIAAEYDGVPAPGAESEATEALRQVQATARDALKMTLRDLPAPDKARLKDQPRMASWGFQIVTDVKSVGVEKVDNVRPH